MNRLHLLMLANAVLIAGVILMTVWGISPMTDTTAFRIVGSSVTLLLYLSFLTIFRMDFAGLESKRLGWVILGLVTVLEGLALLALWDIWVYNPFFAKFAATCGVLVALAFYLLSLREDIVREKRQKDEGYLD